MLMSASADDIKSITEKREIQLFWPVFEVLDAAEAFKPAVHHNSQSGAQSFTLLHAAEDSMK